MMQAALPCSPDIVAVKEGPVVFVRCQDLPSALERIGLQRRGRHFARRVVRYFLIGAWGYPLQAVAGLQLRELALRHKRAGQGVKGGEVRPRCNS